MKTFTLAVIAMCFPGFLLGTAQAAPQCAPHKQLTEALSLRFQEKRHALGVASSGQALFELFVSRQGSWTFTLTDPRGVTCVIGAGEAWQQAPARSQAGLNS